MRGVQVVGVALVGVLVGGCAAGGRVANPAPTTAAAPTTVVAAPTSGPAVRTGVVLAPRPREAPVDGIDPCELLTAAQRVELGLDRPPRSDSALSDFYDGTDVPLCSIRGSEPRSIGVGVSLVPEVGIERWTGGQVAAELRPVSVAGFPALVTVPDRFTEFCSVVIDVAAGQLVDVQFRSAGERPPIPQEQLCLDAEQVANAVMTTLLAR